MNKKILIGSIIAVTVLIGVSFTSVVGYRSGASDVKASPLFNIRCSRAIDEESGDLSCEYVGKGEVGILSIPKRDDRIELTYKIIESIIKMDDKTYDRFIASIIYYFKKNRNYKIENEAIINAFNQLRNEKVIIKTISLRSWDSPCTLDAWAPGCLIFFIIASLIIGGGWLIIFVLLAIYKCGILGESVDISFGMTNCCYE